jgi:hypothetical protein
MFIKFTNGGICPSPLEKSAILMALACHWLAAIVSPFKDSWFHPLSPVKNVPGKALFNTLLQGQWPIEIDDL